MFSHLVGQACLALYQGRAARDAERRTGSPLQGGYPTDILEPLDRPVGSPCWVTLDKRLAREQTYGTPRHLDSLLVRTAPGLRTLRSAAWRGASSDARRSCLVRLGGGGVLL